MAETPKKRTSTPKAAAADKATTAAKPRKTAAKKSANGSAAAMPDNVHTMQDRSVSHEEVARLAHSYYQQRGHKHGHHVEDWIRAEQELRGKAS